MWKPCSLILTIPLTWMTSVLWKYWLSQSVSVLLQHLCGDTKIPTIHPPAIPRLLRYISKVSSPDGFSIHGLWSVTRFKFTKLQDWYGSSLVLSSFYARFALNLDLTNFKKSNSSMFNDQKMISDQWKSLILFWRENISCWVAQRENTMWSVIFSDVQFSTFNK